MKTRLAYMLILLIQLGVAGISAAKDFTFPDSLRIFGARTLDKIAPNSFKATFELKNLTHDSIRGVFYTDCIQSQFSVSTDSVILNGKKFNDYQYEKDVISRHDQNSILHRWIIDLPGSPSPLKQAIVPVQGNLKIYYTLISNASGSFSFSGYSWAGTLGFQTEDAVFGYCDSALVTAVPVELASFAARVIDDAIELIWTTASENKNYGFEVQKAGAGKNFQPLGFVAGAGSTCRPQHYSFIDHEITYGYYFYRLKQIDIDGAVEYSPTIDIQVARPIQFELHQNFPNPFNSITEIRFHLPFSAIVRLVIFNSLGAEIRTLMQARQTAGYTRATWDGKDSHGNAVGSGLYLYRLEVDGHTVAHKKMLLLR